MINWEKTDMWNFTLNHQDCEVESWGGYIGKNEGYTPYGYTIVLENKIYFFGLDGHFIKTKIK